MKALALTILGLFLLVSLASANHQQDPQENGTMVAFDHVGGNEWWVEVRATGNQPIIGVFARDEGGSWVDLEKKTWGVWAGSFHIQPGHHVQFWAEHDDFQQTISCWFTHPGGVEDCGYDPDAGGGADTTFDHRGGNEWWVQVDVTGDPSSVQAMDDGGPWVGLDKKDWGDWAASFHIEPGHDVRFRVLGDAAEWQVSCWFTHPGGLTPTGGQTCGTSDEEPPPPPPPSGDFDATFRTSGGNEWWVEIYVDANEPLAGVDARADDGTWHELTLRSWGAWAESFHVPDGSVVEFRAQSTDGDTVMSGQYSWPSGEPVGDPDPPATFDAAFGPKASNEWWVETLAIADRNLTFVEARANGGAWHQLTLRSWGSWAGSFHAPEGSTVEFRAFDEGGAVSMSDGFLWPDAVPAADPNGEWPQEGSYARYRILQSEPGAIEWRVHATLVHHDGRWLAQCEGTYTDPNGDITEFNEFRETDPPFAPTDVAPGQRVVAGAITHECELSGVDPDVNGPNTYDTHQEGDPVTVATLHGNRTGSCQCMGWEAEWDQETGLVVSWWFGGRSGWVGDLEDTDSPLRTV